MRTSSRPQVDNLENNILLFAHSIREFVKSLPMSIGNSEDARQLVRTSGAVGSTYIRAAGSINRNDYLVGIKNCSTEAKTSHYWLQLLDTHGSEPIELKRQQLMKAANELASVFSVVLANAQQ
jgi:four helix bundle protein